MRVELGRLSFGRWFESNQLETTVAQTGRAKDAKAFRSKSHIRITWDHTYSPRPTVASALQAEDQARFLTDKNMGCVEVESKAEKIFIRREI